MLERETFLFQAVVLDLTLLLLGNLFGLDAFFFGQPRGAFFFALALLVGLQSGFGRNPLRALVGSQLGLALLAGRTLGNGEGTPHLEIDIGARNFEQITSKSVEEAVEDPLNV